MVLPVNVFIKAFALALLALVPTSTCKPTSECGILPDTNKIPWTVGIYLEQQENHLELVCLGSVLKDDYIITASQCVCDSLSKELRKENIYISKKIEKHLMANSDTTFKIEPSNVMKPDEYQGFLINPIGDLAVLKTDRPLLAHPVCVDWFDLTKLLQTNTEGVLSIWDTRVKRVDSSFLDYDSCTLSTSEDFVNMLGADKNCFKTPVSNVAHQSTGSGIFYRNSKDGKWYLEGVVSGSESATDGAVLAATSVRRYLSWLSRVCAT